LLTTLHFADYCLFPEVALNVQPQIHQVRDQPLLKGSLRVAFARSATELRAAQRLRHAIFAGEMGARLHNQIPGVDHDHLDAHCHHLLVWDTLTAEVIGCTRILTEEGARQAGGFYSQSEFEIDPVLALPGRFAEIGRTCVHRDYRNGATITALWSGIAGFVAERRIDFLIGCASIPLGEDGTTAQVIFSELAQRYLTSEDRRVRPRVPLPRRDIVARDDYSPPPLLKAYLRIGAQICGEPFLDEDFQVADVFILVSTRQLTRRYARHFLERAA
jgi:putative hemolysin